MNHKKSRVMWLCTLFLIVCWVFSPLIITTIALWEARIYFKMLYQALWDVTVEVKYEWKAWYLQRRL